MTCLALILVFLTVPCVPCPHDTTRPPPVNTLRERPPTEVHASIGYESLTAGRKDWTDVSVRVQTGAAPGIGLHVEGVRTNRFDLVDSQLRFGMSVRSAGAWSGHGEISLSPTGHVLPNYSAVATLTRALGRGWVVGVGGRHDAHDVGAVDIGTVVADLYVGNFLLGYALSVAFIEGASAAVHRASASRYYGNGNALTVLASAGQSAERVTPQDLLVTDVVVLALWGVHWVDSRLGLTYGVAFNRHQDLYDRRRGEVGVRVRM